MKKGIGFVFLLMVLLSSVGRASEVAGDTIRPPRPKVGIVLGGGGAKGAAHIGVLKYIEEIGLPVDYIVGTSMGSIIGGLYALGYSPEELQKLIAGMDWSKYMSNDVNRRDISSADKNRRSTYLVSIPFNSGELIDKIKSKRIEQDKGDGIPASEAVPSVADAQTSSFIGSLPSSFVSGDDLLNLFNSLCIGYQDPIDFNELPIPFACVATNITTGDPVVIREGKFPEAIRASMAIPGVFSPVTIDGQRLVDGGLVNNFPADICREMGADIIIGIEVARGMIDDVNQLQSLPQLISQLKNIMIRGNNEQNRKLCNLYIHPEVNDFGTLSFTTEAIDTIVQRGYQHATAYREQLLSIKRQLEPYGATKKILHAPKARYITGDTLQLKTITMGNVNDKEFSWLLRKSRLKLSQPIPSSDLDRAINIFKGTGYFSSIQYWLTPVAEPGTGEDDHFNLRFQFVRSEPHSLSLGFNYNSEESAALIVTLGIGQNRFSGWRYNLTGRVGLNPRVNSTVTWAGISLANFNLSYDFQRAKYNNFQFNQSEALTFNRNRVRFYISEFHLRNIQTQVGLEFDHVLYPRKPHIIEENLLRLRNSSWGPYAMMAFDNLDHAFFATQGLSFNMEMHERISRRTETPLTDVSLALQYYASRGRFTFIPQLYTRHLFGEQIQYAYQNIVGGDVMGRYHDYQLPFVGINNTTSTLSHTTIARLDVRYRLYGKHYLTATGNYLRSAPNLGTLISLNDDTIAYGFWGGALKYSYDSPIGPISFDIHYSSLTRDWGSYFSLGYVF